MNMNCARISYCQAFDFCILILNVGEFRSSPPLDGFKSLTRECNQMSLGKNECLIESNRVKDCSCFHFRLLQSEELLQ